jgi:hypothetical protein
MTDLLDTPLSRVEIDSLPSRLRWRYWAGEIGEGVPNLSAIKSIDARHECRSWLTWQRNLSVGARARYVGIAAALQGKACEVRDPSVLVDGLGDLVSIVVPGLPDSFLVARIELEQP